ncbi:hypothetical protein AMTR_s00016p00248150 [Amborella trichopoda]|uniref:Uncharacterized protein n=1 Tax=Amborella trichopoda TaxID=13333 RepID=W1PF77_AMBTC|nr:hypothetical protein AMTR_s00016p00248150 [Amborella trichopoda]
MRLASGSWVPFSEGPSTTVSSSNAFADSRLWCEVDSLRKPNRRRFDGFRELVVKEMGKGDEREEDDEEGGAERETAREAMNDLQLRL